MVNNMLHVLCLLAQLYKEAYAVFLTLKVNKDHSAQGLFHKTYGEEHCLIIYGNATNTEVRLKSLKEYLLLCDCMGRAKSSH